MTSPVARRMSSWFLQHGPEALCRFRLRFVDAHDAQSFVSEFTARAIPLRGILHEFVTSLGFPPHAIRGARLHAAVGKTTRDGTWCDIDLPHAMFDARGGIGWIAACWDGLQEKTHKDVAAAALTQTEPHAVRFLARKPISRALDDTRSFTQNLLGVIAPTMTKGIRLVVSGRGRSENDSPFGNPFLAVDWDAVQLLRGTSLPRCAWTRYMDQLAIAHAKSSDQLPCSPLPPCAQDLPLITSVGNIVPPDEPGPNWSKFINAFVMYPDRVPWSSRVVTAYAFGGMSHVVASGNWGENEAASLQEALRQDAWRIDEDEL